MGVGGGISCGELCAVKSAGLLRYPLHATCDADAVVGGKTDAGVECEVVACFVFACGDVFAAVDVVCACER